MLTKIILQGIVGAGGPPILSDRYEPRTADHGNAPWTIVSLFIAPENVRKVINLV